MRPTPRLIGLLFVCALLALGAAAQPVLLLPGFVAFGLCVALVVVDMIAARAEPAPSLRRELPPRVRIGEPFEVGYVLANAASRARTVELLDDRGAPLGGDLALGPQRVAGGGELGFERTWCASRRGRHAPGPVLALAASPLGLLQQRFALGRDAEPIAVLPNPGSDGGRPPGLEHGAGEQPKRRRGEGMELDALRPYADGDDPRHVDWRATARAGRLVVRTYREERNHSLLIAVDSGRMMASRVGGMQKLDHALGTAVALVHAARLHGDRVGFTAFDAQVRAWLPVSEPRRCLGAMLEASLDLSTCEEEPSYRALSEQLLRGHRKRALLVVLTDFIESADALDMQGHLALLARRHVVLLVALRDPALEAVRVPAPGLDETQLYRRLVLQDLAAERDVVLRRLGRLGVHTLDVPPQRARGPVLARYLKLRGAL